MSKFQGETKVFMHQFHQAERPAGVGVFQLALLRPMIGDTALRCPGVHNLLHGFELNSSALREAHAFRGGQHVDVDNQVVGELGNGSGSELTEMENIRAGRRKNRPAFSKAALSPPTI